MKLDLNLYYVKSKRVGEAFGGSVHEYDALVIPRCRVKNPARDRA
jgi:hypothetical protein